MRILRMAKQSGSLNPGDIAGFEDDKANRLIADKAGVEMIVGVDVDADGQPLRDFGDGTTAAAELDDEDSDGPQQQWKFDAKTDPFVTDGISQQAAKALHAAGLHTVDDVRDYIATEEEAVSAVNAIDGISDAQAEKIVKLYGMVTEHAED